MHLKLQLHIWAIGWHMLKTWPLIPSEYHLCFNKRWHHKSFLAEGWGDAAYISRTERSLLTQWPGGVLQVYCSKGDSVLLELRPIRNWLEDSTELTPPLAVSPQREEEEEEWRGGAKKMAGAHRERLSLGPNEVKDDRVGITNPPILPLLPLLLLLKTLSSPKCSTFPIMPHCFCNSKCSTFPRLTPPSPLWPPHLFQHLIPVDPHKTHTHTHSLASFTLLSRSSLLAALPPLLLLSFFLLLLSPPLLIPLLLSSLCSSSLLCLLQSRLLLAADQQDAHTRTCEAQCCRFFWATCIKTQHSATHVDVKSSLAQTEQSWDFPGQVVIVC